jgi:hypothetical protein
MKRLTLIFVLAIVVMLFSGSGIAQDEGHYYAITTWKLTVPADGSNAELNELFKEWYEKIVSKNDKVLSQKVLRHVTGSDMRDWVVISEYASWNDMDAAGDEQSRLVQEAWPNEDDRRAWFAKFGKYTVTHSDEILQERPELTK